MKILLRLILVFLLASPALCQTLITNEAIWRDGTFSTNSIPGFNFLKDGRHFIRQVENTIKKYDITTGQWVEDIFSSEQIEGQLGFNGTIDRFYFSPDEQKILIASSSEKIYRRSYRAAFHIYDLESEKLHALYEEGKVMNASFSPDGTKVAYVFDNNLYYYDLQSEITLPITFDGQVNEIINGVTDWVYEEEFGFVKAFWWSPDSKKIAFLRFDESAVKEFTMTYYEEGVYPRYQTFKYPKVGETNSELSAFIYDLNADQPEQIDLGEMADMYIPRVKWTLDPDVVCFYKMNRHQNHLKLILFNAERRSSRLLLDEKNPYYIDINDDLTFLKDGKSFIWTSEKSGYNHIYKYDFKGKEIKALTRGNYDVTAYYGFDEANDLVYYQAAKKNPRERQIFQVNSNGKKSREISTMSGFNGAQFSNTFDYHILTHSTINSPPTYSVYDRSGNKIRSIEENTAIGELQKDYGVNPVHFFDFVTENGDRLNGWMIKPGNFDATKKYPVFMYQYSGPGSQQVLDSWRGTNYWWFQMLSQQGYIIACVDGRGTGARGEEFKKMTYMNLGHYETIDQIEAAKYLGRLSYVDASRIGIFGWSYGGYMSSLCILKGNNVFSTAIAVAPVTNWKWYDTVYTERYMRTEKENPNGYKQNSPVYFADKLKGNFLLVHGSGDDNVHFQNSMEMANALISANKQFDQHFYPNRSHGISGDNARLHLYTKMTDFLNENLGKVQQEKDLRP